MTRLVIFFLICALPMLSGCRKDEELLSSTQETHGFVPPEMTLNGSVAGSVTDEYGNPLNGISVKAGNAVAQTDADGLYFFKNVPLNVDGAPVEVNVPGYWHASHQVVPHHNAIHHAHLTVLQKEVKGQFRGDEDGIVSIGAGMDLHFNAYSLRDDSGSDYTNDVFLTARGMSSVNTEDGRLLPGGLRGIDGQDRVRSLRSFGMFAGIVHGPSGALLQPDEDKPAVLMYTPDSETPAGAPPVLGVWYLDEAAGYWRKSGEAVKEGGRYRAEIPHFSFWGLFEDFDPASVSGVVLSAWDSPAADAQVSFWADGAYLNSVFTDTEGVFQANLPAGPDLDIFITDGCNVTVFTQNIGSIGDDTDLGEISVPADDFTTVSVSGSAVNCAGAAIDTDYATVCTDSGCSQLFLNAEGSFDQTLGLCGDEELTFFFFDQATGQSAVVTAEAEESLHIGEVVLCDSSAEEFISLTVNGETHFYPNPFSIQTLSVQTVRATDYSYNIRIAWQSNLFSTGTFTGDDVEFGYIEEVTGTGSTELLQASCDFGSCEGLTVVIETYNLEDEVIEGTYSGTITYTSSINGDQPNTNIEGAFRVSF